MSFNINYKGTSCRGTLFLYKCNACTNTQEETHPAADEPVIQCSACGTDCTKKPTVPSLDADHHDSMLSHNIGWDEDG